MCVSAFPYFFLFAAVSIDWCMFLPPSPNPSSAPPPSPTPTFLSLSLSGTSQELFVRDPCQVFSAGKVIVLKWVLQTIPSLILNLYTGGDRYRTGGKKLHWVLIVFIISRLFLLFCLGFVYHDPKCHWSREHSNVRSCLQSLIGCFEDAISDALWKEYISQSLQFWREYTSQCHLKWVHFGYCFCFCCWFLGGTLHGNIWLVS